MNDFKVINLENNIINNLDEEDHFYIAYQMLNNGQLILNIEEGYNEIENISASNKEQFNNNFSELQESSQLFGRSNSLCIVSESNIYHDPLNISKKCKSCKNLIYCKRI